MALVVAALSGLALGLVGRGLLEGAAERATRLAALLLVLLMGMEASGRLLSPRAPEVLLAGLALALVPGALSVALAMAMLGRLEAGTRGGVPPAHGLGGTTYLCSMALGVLLGAVAPWDAGPLLGPLLYALVFAASYTVGSAVARSRKGMGVGLRIGAVLTLAVLSGGALGGLATALVLGLDKAASVLSGAASGWYSLVGPLLLAYDPGLAAAALLGNMLREALHVALYPYLSRRIPLSAIALGGATTMDTGLPVVAACGGDRERTAAFVQGTATTLALSVALPAAADALL